MPSSPTGLGRWIHLGRILPRRVRERIFEPAFYDLLGSSLRSERPSAIRFGGHALAIFTGAFTIALRRILLSRQGLAFIAILLFVIMLLLLRDWFETLYDVAYTD